MSGADYMIYARERLSVASSANTRGESPVRNGPDALRGEPRNAAVTVLFTLQNTELCVVMIRRSATGGQHRTEWAFPGGIVERTDASLLRAALRETEEELGIGAELIDIWGPLPSVITGTGYEVWPFTGSLRQGVSLDPADDEVDDVAYVPVRVLLDRRNRRSITLVRRDGEREWDAIAYGGRVIWGASARIISSAISFLDPERHDENRPSAFDGVHSV